MIAVVQRVSRASVVVGEQTVGRIGSGLAVLVSVCRDDTEQDVEWTARKLAEMRLFAEGEKGFHLDVREAGGSVLLVSNFTVAAATRHGRRPSFDAAADATKGAELFKALAEAMRALGVPTETGSFGADMQVNLVNEGPVTVIVNSSEAR